MINIYMITGLILCIAIGLAAVWYEKQQSPLERAAAKLPYLKFMRFVSSWKFFVLLLVPSIVIDVVVYDGEANYFFWFLVLYGFFIFPFAYTYRRKFILFKQSGEDRLASYESKNEEKILRQEMQNKRYYLFIIVSVILYFLYMLIVQP